jgi:hypothetical protein
MLSYSLFFPPMFHRRRSSSSGTGLFPQHDLRAGRQEEQRQEKNTRYYVLNDQPRARTFGPADYVDEEGRQYRLAVDSGEGTLFPSVAVPGKNQVKLWVKLPPNVSWFALNGLRGTTRITLERQHDGLVDLGTVVLDSGYLDEPKRRTGHVMIMKPI